MLTLFGVGFSRSFRTLWALEETDLPFTYTHVEFGSPNENGALSEDYRRLNPQGKVPTLVHEAFVLTESAAIMDYVAQLAPEAQLFVSPQESLSGYGAYLQLRDFILTELEQPLWSNGKHRFALPKEQRIEGMLNTATYEFNKALGALNALYSGETFALEKAGIPRFTLCDTLLAQTTHWAERFKFDLPAHLLEHRDRMYERPAAKRALKQLEAYL
ncbi:MAG: glutathione S-transferase family protein [Pseudomonadota bacterium]|nr:glutathione S-transferase family protein [Pseudomonadota bacterium]